MPELAEWETFCLIVGGAAGALLGAPWHAIVPLAAAWCAAGVAGVVYSGVVVRRMRRQRAYRPELEDWVFHAVLPLLAYAVLVISAFPAPAHLHEALFGVGAAALLLLFIGIHNAWDSIAYHVFVSRQNEDRD